MNITSTPGNLRSSNSRRVFQAHTLWNRRPQRPNLWCRDTISVCCDHRLQMSSLLTGD